MLDASNVWQLVLELRHATGLAEADSIGTCLHARHADPICTFGDLCAVSDTVDDETAVFLKTKVSDGSLRRVQYVASDWALRSRDSGV